MIVELINIQSIKKATYILEEKGITQITGDNSNGKSILIKAMSFVANTNIKDKDERESIINDNSTLGSITMERNNMRLKVVVSRARENCYYELTRSNGSVITRTIREGGLELLAEEFGWVAFDGNICLQIFETFGVMPFVNNRASSDYEIIDYIITDKVANDFIETYESITYPAFKKYASNLKSTVDNVERTLSSITFYDIPKHEDILYKLKNYQRNLEYIKICNVEKLPITKALKYVEINLINVVRLPIFKIIPLIEETISLSRLLDDYHLALNGKCPTCGTKLKDREGCCDAV